MLQMNGRVQFQSYCAEMQQPNDGVGPGLSLIHGCFLAVGCRYGMCKSMKAEECLPKICVHAKEASVALSRIGSLDGYVSTLTLCQSFLAFRNTILMCHA